LSRYKCPSTAPWSWISPGSSIEVQACLSPDLCCSFWNRVFKYCDALTKAYSFDSAGGVLEEPAAERVRLSSACFPHSGPACFRLDRRALMNRCVSQLPEGTWDHSSDREPYSLQYRGVLWRIEAELFLD